MVLYAWALGMGQICIAVVALIAASKYLANDWRRQTLYPVIIGLLPAVASSLLVRQWDLHLPALLYLTLSATVFGCVFFLTMRLFFPEALRHVLNRMPGSQHWLSLLRFT